MDERLQSLERAFRETTDAGAALELARGYLRAGQALRALTFARLVPDAPERPAAARLLAERRGVTFTGVVDGFERFHRGGLDLVLVPGGAFLDDGARAWSGGPPGGRRAALREVTLPDLLLSLDAWTGAATWAEASDAAARLGGRLPSPEEWKKCWRGGLHLDGDVTARRPLLQPDRIGPWAPGDPPPLGAPAVSVYGVRFALETCEWTSRPGVGIGYRGGRFHVAPDDPAARDGRVLVWRVVVDLEP